MTLLRWAALAAVMGLWAASAWAMAEAPPAGGEGVPPPSDPLRTAVLAASVAFVTAVSILGAAYAVGRIGSAALGAAAEKPELLLRSLPLVGLAEGLAVIGFIVAILLLGKF